MRQPVHLLQGTSIGRSRQAVGPPKEKPPEVERKPDIGSKQGTLDQSRMPPRIGRPEILFLPCVEVPFRKLFLLFFRLILDRRILAYLLRF